MLWDAGVTAGGSEMLWDERPQLGALLERYNWVIVPNCVLASLATCHPPHERWEMGKQGVRDVDANPIPLPPRG